MIAPWIRTAAVLIIAGFWAPLVVARNIVLFVADDHGRDAGCYGNDVVQTPHLDALARAGVTLDYAFCTTASCSASRSVILTGLHNHLNGQFGHVHHYHKFSTFVNVASLPTYLRAAGYRTARAGKYHVAPEAVYRFDEQLGSKGRNTVAQANACEPFLAKQDDRPFLLYFCTTDPHRSGSVIQDDPQQPNAFGNRDSLPGIEPLRYDPDDVVVPAFLPDTPACRAELAQYYESVSRVDQGLGRLVALLKQTGHWEDTLLLYISDHGIAMPGAKTTLYEPGMRSPGIIRVPKAAKPGSRSTAMVSWVDIVPTLLEYAEILDPVSKRIHEDVLREVRRELAGRAGQRLKAIEPGRFHGESFLASVQADQSPINDEDAVFGSHTFHEIQMYYPMRVVRERRWKLIWNLAHRQPFPFASDLWAAPTWQRQYEQGLDAAYGRRTVGAYIHRPQFELYDLQADPHEAHNLAEDPHHQENLVRMKQRLREFQQRTSDPWIMKWQYE